MKAERLPAGSLSVAKYIVVKIKVPVDSTVGRHLLSVPPRSRSNELREMGLVGLLARERGAAGLPTTRTAPDNQLATPVPLLAVAPAQQAEQPQIKSFLAGLSADDLDLIAMTGASTRP